MKLWLVIHIYDIGSCHPECDVSPFTDSGAAVDCANEISLQEGVPFEGAFEEDDDGEADYSQGYVKIEEVEV